MEIVYVERDDKWNFTVNGRERNLESLAKAKESIDRALNYERKERPWKPFTAYYKRYSGDDFQLVTVTSQADPGRYNSGVYFWISKQDGRKKERSKESQFDLYAATPENEQRIARWRELDTQIDALSKEQRELQESMTHIERPKAVEAV